MSASADRQVRSAFSSGQQQLIASQPRGQRQSSADPARRWMAIGSIVADLAPKKGTPPRLVSLNVSIGLVAQAPAPWAARFWEQDAPPGVQPVEWFLRSRSSVTCLEDALELLDSTRGLVTTYAVT